MTESGKTGKKRKQSNGEITSDSGTPLSRVRPSLAQERKRHTQSKRSHKSKKASKAKTDDAKVVAEKYRKEEKDADVSPIHVNAGDCVLLNSGDPNDMYIALVSSVERTQQADKSYEFTAQWYYKPKDIPDEVLQHIKGGVLDGEVFLSTHKDKNHVDAVADTCHVVTPEEYIEVQRDIKRGFKEKVKEYYTCRFKYYPSRSNKKALVPVKNNEIRSGLGPPKPNIGADYQANVPEQISQRPCITPEELDQVVPWAKTDNGKSRKGKKANPCRQIWSSLALERHASEVRAYTSMVDGVKFATGNVLKTFHWDTVDGGLNSHIRCVVLKDVGDEVQVALPNGDTATILKSKLSSPLTDDVALKFLYLARFSLARALHDYTAAILESNEIEKEAFKKEITQMENARKYHKSLPTVHVESAKSTLEMDEA